MLWHGSTTCEFAEKIEGGAHEQHMSCKISDRMTLDYTNPKLNFMLLIQVISCFSLPDVAAHFHVGRQQPRRALRARGCRSAAAGQTTSGKLFAPSSRLLSYSGVSTSIIKHTILRGPLSISVASNSKLGLFPKPRYPERYLPCSRSYIRFRVCHASD